MASSKSFKYGMPIYGLAWPAGDTIFLCGGGGMGIKNRLVCASVKAGLLTDQIAEYQFGENCPMRLAIPPNGKSIVFAMGQGGIKRLYLDATGKVPKLTEMTGELQAKLSEIQGEVKSICFRPSGSHLALGFNNGDLVVYDWPSVKPRLNLIGDKKLADSIRDMDFSPDPVSGSRSGAAPPSGSRSSSRSDGSLLAVTIDNGSCELWDWEKGRLLCRLEPGKSEEGRGRDRHGRA